jgi:CheY-like chemotaxis protein
MQFRLPPAPMFIRADPGMIDQIMLNLIVNAADAMPDGGDLVIETSGMEFDEFAAALSADARVGAFVCLSVSDSGHGMSSEVMGQIFEPFFTTKDVGRGTGLGLATVYGIVQQHQGWINVYSEVGHGTTFRVYLPRLPGHPAQKPAAPAPPPVYEGHETILLVEDDAQLRASVQTALSRLGYRVLDAPNGATGLAVWQQHQRDIQLVITDLVMPDRLTGVALANRMTQDRPGLKVIYMSGYSAQVAGRDVPLQEGINFLTKPFQAQKLAKIVRTRLDS